MFLGGNKYIEEKHGTAWIEAPSPPPLQYHVISERGGGGIRDHRACSHFKFGRVVMFMEELYIEEGIT